MVASLSARNLYLKVLTQVIRRNQTIGSLRLLQPYFASDPANGITGAFRVSSLEQFSHFGGRKLLGPNDVACNFPCIQPG